MNIEICEKCEKWLEAVTIEDNSAIIIVGCLVVFNPEYILMQRFKGEQYIKIKDRMITGDKCYSRDDKFKNVIEPVKEEYIALKNKLRERNDITCDCCYYAEQIMRIWNK